MGLKSKCKKVLTHYSASGRKDDILSALYLMLYLIRNGLPWTEVREIFSDQVTYFEKAKAMK